MAPSVLGCRPFFVRRLGLIAALCAAGMFTSVISHAMPWWSNTRGVVTAAWSLDLLAHFQWGYAAAGFVASLLLVLLTRRLLHFVFASLFILVPWVLASKPVAFHPDATEVSAQPAGDVEVLGLRDPHRVDITVVAANVHATPAKAVSNLRATASWPMSQAADVLALVELTTAAAGEIPKLWPGRHTALMPSNDSFGVGIVSKWPVLKHWDWINPHTGSRWISAEISVHGLPVRVAAIHPRPPLGDAMSHEFRSLDLKALVEDWSQREPMPSLIAGDFNATVWSSLLHRLQDRGFLRATNVTPTWPAWWGGWMGIPIDHILVGGQRGAWLVRDHGRAPALGSDHLAVWSKLSLMINASRAMTRSHDTSTTPITSPTKTGPVKSTLSITSFNPDSSREKS